MLLREHGVEMLLVERIHILVAPGMMARAATESRCTNESSASFTIASACVAMRGKSRLIFTGGSWVKITRAFGDLGGLVADAFEILGNFHRHGHETQVAGQWRLGQKLDGHLIDLNLEFVNDVVVRAHLHGQVVVALHERLHGLVDGFLGVAGHHQKFLAQVFDARFKMIFHSLNSKGSTEPSAHIILRALLRRVGENLRGRAVLHQFAHVKERRLVGDARGLLHVVRHNDDGEILFQI